MVMYITIQTDISSCIHVHFTDQNVLVCTLLLFFIKRENVILTESKIVAA